MVDRVRRPDTHTETLRILKDEGEIFSSYKDALVFAASLGISREKRVSFEKYSEPIPMSVFRGEFDEAFMNVMALFDEKDPTYLESEGSKFDSKIKMFEEYACGGLDIIKTSIIEPGLKIQDELIRMILSEDAEHDLIVDITSLS